MFKGIKKRPVAILRIMSGQIPVSGLATVLKISYPDYSMLSIKSTSASMSSSLAGGELAGMGIPPV